MSDPTNAETMAALTDPESYRNRRLTCDLVMKGGITSGVVYPLAVAQLARSYRFANIGGTSAGAIAAAAAAAAQHDRSGLGFTKLAKLPSQLGDDLEALFRPQRRCARLFRVAIALTRTPDSMAGRVGRAFALVAAFVRFVLTPVGFAILALLGAPAVLTGIGLREELGARVGHGAVLLVAILTQLWLAGSAARSWRNGEDESGNDPEGRPRSTVMLLMIGLVVVMGSATRIGGVTAWIATGWLALCVASFVLAVMAAMAIETVRVLPRNDYGLVGGSRAETRDSDVEPLSEWLHIMLQDLAGLDPAGEPLTFGQLLDGPGEEHPGCNLTLLTTCITQGRTYYLPYDLGHPEDDDRFYVDPDELVRSMPSKVVDVLRREPAEPDWLDRALAPLVRLPEPAHIPVVMATRMSLSFPALISAVPLRAVDWTLESNQEARRQWRAWERGRGDDPSMEPPVVAPVAERCWFSDGGIISNFPVHLFDQMLPAHPTFGMNLRGFHPDRVAFDDERQPEDEKIWRPSNNGSGSNEWWTRWSDSGVGAIGGFVGALKNSIQNWSDNDQTRVPGYRDRVVHVSHGKREGGLNLAMPRSVIKRLGERGRLAAVELEVAFSGPEPPEGVVTGWRNHKWVRLRSSMALLTNELTSITNQMDVADPTGVESYRDLLDGPLDEAPSYAATRGQRNALLAFLEDDGRGVLPASRSLSEQIAARPTLAPTNGAPGPEPDLRITPGHRERPPGPVGGTQP